MLGLAVRKRTAAAWGQLWAWSQEQAVSKSHWLLSFGPEVDFDFLIFARCGELDGAVFGFVESEVGEEWFLRKLFAHHKDMLIEAVEPRLLGEEGLEGFHERSRDIPVPETAEWSRTGMSLLHEKRLLLGEVLDDFASKKLVDFAMSRNGFGTSSLRVVVDIMLPSMPEEMAASLSRFSSKDRGASCCFDFHFIHLADAGDGLARKEFVEVFQVSFEIVKIFSLGPVVRVVIEISQKLSVFLSPVSEFDLH